MDDAAIEGFHYRPNTTAVEVEQMASRSFAMPSDLMYSLIEDGSPMLPAVGYTDLGRLSTDTGHSFRERAKMLPGLRHAIT